MFVRCGVHRGTHPLARGEETSVRRLQCHHWPVLAGMLTQLVLVSPGGWGGWGGGYAGAGCALGGPRPHRAHGWSPVPCILWDQHKNACAIYLICKNEGAFSASLARKGCVTCLFLPMRCPTTRRRDPQLVAGGVGMSMVHCMFRADKLPCHDSVSVLEMGACLVHNIRAYMRTHVCGYACDLPPLSISVR